MIDTSVSFSLILVADVILYPLLFYFASYGCFLSVKHSYFFTSNVMSSTKWGQHVARKRKSRQLHFIHILFYISINECISSNIILGLTLRQRAAPTRASSVDDDSDGGSAPLLITFFALRPPPPPPTPLSLYNKRKRCCQPSDCPPISLASSLVLVAFSYRTNCLTGQTCTLAVRHMVFSQCSAPWERARKRQRTRRFNKLVFKLAEFVALPPKGIELKGTKKIS